MHHASDLLINLNLNMSLGVKRLMQKIACGSLLSKRSSARKLSLMGDLEDIKESMKMTILRSFFLTLEIR